MASSILMLEDKRHFYDHPLSSILRPDEAEKQLRGIDIVSSGQKSSILSAIENYLSVPESEVL